MVALVLDDAVLGKEDTILAGGARAEHVHEEVLGGVKTHVVNPRHVGVADDDVLLPHEVVDVNARLLVNPPRAVTDDVSLPDERMAVFEFLHLRGEDGVDDCDVGGEVKGDETEDDVGGFLHSCLCI